jgi:hypothetical protein
VGNCAASPADIGGNKIDRKAPSITITTPSSGPYTLNQAVAAGFACSDGGSGVGACVGTVANGANIDTTTVGGKTFTVNATDNVGNAATPQSRTYTVVYAAGSCTGQAGHTVLQPVNADHTSVFKKNSTVPVKFRVCDANGVSIGANGPVVAVGGDGHRAPVVISVAGNVGAVDEAVVSTTPDVDFRWDATDKQWIFNLNTKNLVAGVHYYYAIHLLDGTDILFDFGVK